MGRYLVTGGAGFIGSRIARSLVERGDEVSVLDDLSTGFAPNVPGRADLIEADIADPQTYARLRPEGIEAVLHLGGQSSGEISHLDPLHDFDVNARGTFLLLRWCERHGIRRILFASSMAVYGPSEKGLRESEPARPQSFYGASKLAAEGSLGLFGRHGGQPTIFRLFNVYGPGQNLENLRQGMASIYLAYLLRGDPVLVKGSFERYRDFVYVDDVADAWIRALQEPASVGMTLNLGSGNKTTVRELIDGLIAAFGYRPREYPVIQGEQTMGDVLGSFADASLARQVLSWSPKVSLGEGLAEMVKWALSTGANAQCGKRE